MSPAVDPLTAAWIVAKSHVGGPAGHTVRVAAEAGAANTQNVPSTVARATAARTRPLAVVRVLERAWMSVSLFCRIRRRARPHIESKPCRALPARPYIRSGSL